MHKLITNLLRLKVSDKAWREPNNNKLNNWINQTTDLAIDYKQCFFFCCSAKSQRNVVKTSININFIDSWCLIDWVSRRQFFATSFSKTNNLAIYSCLKIFDHTIFEFHRCLEIYSIDFDLFAADDYARELSSLDQSCSVKSKTYTQFYAIHFHLRCCQCAFFRNQSD